MQMKYISTLYTKQNDRNKIHSKKQPVTGQHKIHVHNYKNQYFVQMSTNGNTYT